MPQQETKRSRLLFTFAAGDLGVARPFAERLRAADDALAVDLSLTSEPFATQRADYIRASLEVRIRRALATVCLFGPDTFADDWVLWTLEATHDCGRAIVAAPIVAPSPQAVDLFSALGAAMVPMRAESFVRHVTAIEEGRLRPAAVGETATLVLRAMRHPVR